MRTIMLLDMDYFFAACEELRHPEFKDKPVIVGADPKEGKGRGVVSTCNYIARKFGIHSAMPISMAYRLKQDAVFLPVDYSYYENTSEKVMASARVFASKFEQVSIDEAFMDVSDRVSNYEQAIEYAKRIKEAIKSSHKLPCSIGIGPNKLIAKMACEAGKPDGIKLVKEEDARQFLSLLPVGKLYGIGGKTAERLEKMNVKTVSDLANVNPMMLIGTFGTFGGEIGLHAKGIDNDEVIQNYEIKSIGRERTFEEDTMDREIIIDKLKLIAQEVGLEVKKQGVSFKTVTVKIRYLDFSEHMKSRSMNRYSEDTEEMLKLAIKLFDQYAERGKQVRKIGIRVSGLVNYKGQKKMKDFFK